MSGALATMAAALAAGLADLAVRRSVRSAAVFLSAPFGMTAALMTGSLTVSVTAITVVTMADLLTIPSATSAEPTKAMPGHADIRMLAAPWLLPKSAFAARVARTPSASMTRAVHGERCPVRADHRSAADAAPTVPSTDRGMSQAASAGWPSWTARRSMCR